jgi:hypothetical protein
MLGVETWRNLQRFFDFAEPKMPFASVSRFVYLLTDIRSNGGR